MPPMGVCWKFHTSCECVASDCGNGMRQYLLENILYIYFPRCVTLCSFVRTSFDRRYRPLPLCINMFGHGRMQKKTPFLDQTFQKRKGNGLSVEGGSGII